MRILPYLSMPAEFRAYDPQVVEVAHRLAGAIQRVEPQLKVEHVGSTSVPGCGGKGINAKGAFITDALKELQSAV